MAPIVMPVENGISLDVRHRLVHARDGGDIDDLAVLVDHLRRRRGLRMLDVQSHGQRGGGDDQVTVIGEIDLGEGLDADDHATVANMMSAAPPRTGAGMDSTTLAREQAQQHHDDTGAGHHPATLDAGHPDQAHVLGERRVEQG